MYKERKERDVKTFATFGRTISAPFLMVRTTLPLSCDPHEDGLGFKTKKRSSNGFPFCRFFGTRQ
jgi:hypothetical protein